MSYKEKIGEVIRASWFSVEPGNYVYTSVKEVFCPEKHLMITRDREEITVVTLEENLHLLGSYERNRENWKLMNIRCGKPFYCVGFLASISSVMAENGFDIVMVSTFSNDYVMVKEQELKQCAQLLQSIGFTLKNELVTA